MLAQLQPSLLILLPVWSDPVVSTERKSGTSRLAFECNIPHVCTAGEKDETRILKVLHVSSF